MKKAKPIFFLVVALAAVSMRAQSWETVDLVQPPTEGPSYYYRDLCAAPGGYMYALGPEATSDSGGPKPTWLRRSADAGQTWHNVSALPAGIKAVAADHLGRVFLAGNSTPETCVLWRSSDLGATWSEFDSYNVGVNGVQDLAVAENGTVFVVGHYVDAQTGYRIWMVRRGVPTGDGYTWANVDPFSFDKTLSKPDRITDGRPASVAIASRPDGQVEIYVGGRTSNSRIAYGWCVRRSLDGGATWTTADLFETHDMGWGFGELAISPADGSIYAVGRTYIASRKSGQYVGLIRKGVRSATGSITWSNVDTVALPGFAFVAVTVQPSGAVHAAAWESDSRSWVIRASASGSGPFSTTDVVASALPFSLATDSFGNVYAAGRLDPSGGLIRALPTPQP